MKKIMIGENIVKSFGEGDEQTQCSKRSVR